MSSYKKFAALILIFSTFRLSVSAQTGGAFDLSHNVIAGGGMKSAGGVFTLEGTIGQPVAGTNSTGGTNPIFSLRGGFWAFGALAPTAAAVSISGRVTFPNGKGINRAVVTLTDAQGAERYAATDFFGRYRFDEVAVGEIYILAARHKQHSFNQSSQILSVNQELSGINFVADG